MSTLTKLLDMLNQVKEENPELANKALLAAETLKSGLEIEEEVVEEEEYDDSYVEVSKEDTNEYFHLKHHLLLIFNTFLPFSVLSQVSQFFLRPILNCLFIYKNFYYCNIAIRGHF